MNNEQGAIRNEQLTKKCFPRSNSLLFVFFIALCSLLIVIISCQNPLLPPKQGDSLPANTGSFSFTIGDNNARTILPSTPVLGEFAMYTLAFTAAGGGAVNLSADRNNTNLANPFVLAAGTYDLTVSAYKDTGKTQLMAQGTLSGIVITAGGNTARSVVLKPLLGETGTSGTFSWDIGISTSGITFSAASMTIKDSASVQSDIVVDLTAAPSGSRTLASGVYTVTFTLEGTESGVKKAVVFNEILYIYSELTSRFPSSGTFTFTDSHFHNTHWNITFDENYSGGGSAVQSVPHGTYTLTEAPARGGWVFDGWDTAADGSGTRYMPGDEISVHADMTLYAQWFFSYVEALKARIAVEGSDSASSPAMIILDPAVFTTAASVPDGVIGWSDINTAVKDTAKYVVLDLSNISFDGNTITGKFAPSGNDMNLIQNTAYIKGIILPDTLESIGAYGFCACTALTGPITIPDSVTSMGAYVFSGCTALTGVTIPDSITSIGSRFFNGCTALASVNIPSGVTSIGMYAFYDCRSLSGPLTIPAGVTSIGSNAFYGCKGFTGALTIPAGVTSIETYAFAGCSGLSGPITIPDSVTSIENNAFQNCSGFSGALNIPANVTSIGNSAFYGCSGLTGTLTIPSSVTSIGSYAFQGCSSLTGALTIPDTVTTIGTFAFQNCSGFTGALTISANVTIIGNRTFYGCSGLSGALTIPSNVTIIETYAFQNCSGLTGTLTIPSSVTSIADNAFDSCSGLSGSVIIPDGITSIAGNTFRGCTNLAGVDIPATVDSIAANAFYNCTSLASVKFGKAGVTIAGTTTFINSANSTALQTAYTAGGAGTYTRPNTTSTVWTKQP